MVFAWLALLVFRIGTGASLRSMNKTYILWIMMAFWFLLPSPFATTLWMCGSCVYLWMALLEFLFLLPFALKYWNPSFWETPPSWSVPLMAVSGLGAGWSVETGAAATGFIAFFALWHFHRQGRLQPWMMAGFLFLCLGGVLLTQAPGETVRLALQREFEYNPELPPEMYWTPLMFSLTFTECFWPVVRMWIPPLLLILYYVRQLPEGMRWNPVTKFQAVFIAGALSVMIVMLFVPMAPPRAGFFSTVAVITASLPALRELLPKRESLYKAHRSFFRAAFAVCIALWLATTAIVLYVEWDVRTQWMNRIDYINARRDQDLVVVHQIDVPPIADAMLDIFDYYFTWNTDILAWGSDLEPRPEGSHNLMYAQYYGWKKVITDGEDRRTLD